jgi:hypothetical protein
LNESCLMERWSLISYCATLLKIALNPSPESLAALLRDPLETEQDARAPARLPGQRSQGSAGQGMLLPGSGLTDRGWSDGLAGRQGQLTRGRWSTQYRWRRPGAGSSTGTCSQPPQTARARSAGVSGIPGRERGGRRALPHRSLRELLHSWSGGMLRSFRATRVPALRAFRRLLSYALLRA